MSTGQSDQCAIAKLDARKEPFHEAGVARCHYLFDAYSAHTATPYCFPVCQRFVYQAGRCLHAL